ncbi:pyridoxal-dependent decarboxylase [Pavlovales sp. CCMP2436]|nr:pyridoxal-dependent decarboxylase [Pavlovales sp. CCMP2436]
MEGEIGAFNMCDLEIVREQHVRFRRNLPRVQPYYAMKCNPDERVVKLLAEEGCNFDCASKAEIEIAMAAGATADRMIFANPCKQPSHVAFAAAQGVQLSTFDGADELFKIAALQPDARLVFRVMVDDSHSVCTMSQKYGAPLSHLPELLAVAKSLNLNVCGVSFHVGSGSMSAEPYRDAVRTARSAFDIAAEHGVQMSLLDIGGGFPGDATQVQPDNAFEPKAGGVPQFEEIAAVARRALDEFFPEGSGVRIIAEPGRYMVNASSTLVTNIIGRKFANKGTSLERPMYFVNDGLYGSFNCVLYDHATPSPLPLFSNERNAIDREHDMSQFAPCSIWGSTCDGMDCISKEASLPLLSVGDWIRWPNMGAYTSAAGSTFNGMDRPTKYYL